MKQSFGSQVVNIFRTSLLGGFVVILPITIFLFMANWIFTFIRKMISPLSELIYGNSEIQGLLADALVIVIILSACFLVGFFVKTRLGTWIYESIEGQVIKIAPGYSLIKEIVMQFLGNKKAPFSEVALARIFGNETQVTSFVTDHHDDGSYTVFVPTGPNPTSGNIYHLKPEYIEIVDVPVEETMRSIISCGAGSTNLLLKLREKAK